jgi:hypothetical protein
MAKPGREDGREDGREQEAGREHRDLADEHEASANQVRHEPVPLRAPVVELIVDLEVRMSDPLDTVSHSRKRPQDGR